MVCVYFNICTHLQIKVFLIASGCLFSIQKYIRKRKGILISSFNCLVGRKEYICHANTFEQMYKRLQGLF